MALKKQYPEFAYLALVRSEAVIQSVKSVGVFVVRETFSNYDLVSMLSEHSDLIINAADSDTVELTEAILKGMKERYMQGNGAGTLIHTSGTCNFFGEESSTAGERQKTWTVSISSSSLVNSEWRLISTRD